MRPSNLSWLALAICCVSSYGLCGCQREAAPPPRVAEKARRTNSVRFRDALAALLRNRDSRQAIITFEADTRKFVQFTGSAGEGLHLGFDLPKDKAEAERAESLFKDLGIEGEENNVYEDPYGKPTRRIRVFRKSFGQDVEAAANVAERIFERVYQLPADFPLHVSGPPELLTDP